MNFLIDPIPFVSEWVRTFLTNLGLSPLLVQIVSYVVGGFILAAGSMFFVLFLIWVERKLIGRLQDRFGPNRLGPWGVIQPIADMLKIFTKEHIIPTGVDRVPYELAPVITMAAVIMIWAVLPFTVSTTPVDLSVGVLYIFAVGSLGEMGVILAGWGSNNKYALLGAFRVVAQLISYSVPMVIVMLIPVMLSGSISLSKIVLAQNVWYVFLAPVPALIFFISSVAEVGRAPFDLAEAESELVSGFNIEYSGLKFGMFFVADFLHAFTIALLFAALFMGGWKGPFVEKLPILGFVYFFIKTWVVYFMVILMRGTLPRVRIDQMNDLNWKFFTPFALVAVMLTAIVVKLLPVASTLVKVVALLIVNGLIAGLMLWFARTAMKRVKIHVVIPKKLPTPAYSVKNINK
jgi:NADH-quinone oxidoreductase subunit H